MRTEPAIAFSLVTALAGCAGNESSSRSDGGETDGRSHSTLREASVPPGSGGSLSTGGGSSRDASRRATGGVSSDSSLEASRGGSSRRDAGKSSDDSGPDADSTLPPIENCVGSTPLITYVSDPNLCVYVFASGLGAVRQMAFAPNGDLFVNNGKITVLWDANRDGVSSAAEQSAFGTSPGSNHGLVFSPDGKYVYVSSPIAVFRFSYTYGDRVATTAAETVIKGMSTGGHVTRTLAFDSKGNLFVSVGSASNVDATDALVATRGQVRRFTLPSAIPAGGIDYSTGTIVASGMRNEVGLYVDGSDRIWGVENGRDDLKDADFGGDIHIDNPGEEINLIDGKGSTNYGYPYCYSEREFPMAGGRGAGTQWADQSLPAAMQKTDAWCQSTANVHPPEAVMQAHWAPLGIIQYTGNSLPFKGDLVITAHGSWDRAPAVGRLLARATLSNGKVTSITPIVGEKGAAGLAEGTWDARPVDVRMGPDEALYFSDDSGGRVFKVGYRVP
jgi:glucose/arabinose dehydrogenase